MKFAVIKTGGKQYKVKEGQELKIEKLGVEEGKKVKFDQVLLLNDNDDVKIGKPYLKDVKVEAEILENGKGKKVEVVKYKPKIRYKKTFGHRQHFTKIKILKIA